MRVVHASPLLIACAVACANAPQREETAPPLVVPPMSGDAGAAHVHEQHRTEVPPSLAVPARDPRPSMRTPRAANELHAEISNLEQETTPSALHQLAETYCELARVERGGSARAKAIASYEELVSKFPTYTGLDEALYYLGVEHEIANDKTKARRWYYELIKRRPASQLVPYAYFGFGEMFFEEGATDPSKNTLAQHAFAEVLKYPQTPLLEEAKKRLEELKQR